MDRRRPRSAPAPDLGQRRDSRTRRAGAARLPAARAGDEGRRARRRPPGGAQAPLRSAADRPVGDRRERAAHVRQRRLPALAVGRRTTAARRTSRRSSGFGQFLAPSRDVPAATRASQGRRAPAHHRRHPRSASTLRPRRAGRHRGATASPGYQIPAAQLRWLAGDGTVTVPRPDPRAACACRRPAHERVLRRPLPRRGAQRAGHRSARAHRPGAPRGTRGTRAALPHGGAPGAVLLADDGARRRHRIAERREPAQRPADPGELRPALRPRRPQRPAGAGLHVLLELEQPRPVLLRRPGADGLRPGRAAAARPRQRGPRPRPRPRRVARRDRPVARALAHRPARRRRRRPDARPQARRSEPRSNPST